MTPSPQPGLGAYKGTLWDPTAKIAPGQVARNSNLKLGDTPVAAGPHRDPLRPETGLVGRGVTLDSISNSSLTRADFRAAPMMIYQYYPEFRVGSFAGERGSAANRAYLTCEISKMV